MTTDYRADAPPQAVPAPRRKPSTRTLMLGGVGAALVLGLAAGALIRPQLDTGDTAAPSTGQMAVELNAPAMAPVAKPSGKLEVLPADMAAAAAPARPAPAAVSMDQAQQAPLQPTAAPTPPPMANAGFDCGDARGLAEQMVCSDPGLAAQDREMARAYRRALRSGAPMEDIRDDQRDWLDIREEAARQSPGALASVYRQRIDELNGIADGQ